MILLGLSNQTAVTVRFEVEIMSVWTSQEGSLKPNANSSSLETWLTSPSLGVNGALSDCQVCISEGPPRFSSLPAYHQICARPTLSYKSFSVSLELTCSKLASGLKAPPRFASLVLPKLPQIT